MHMYICKWCGFVHFNVCHFFNLRFRFEEEDVKIDVFDLAGQPFFYEVHSV